MASLRMLKRLGKCLVKYPTVAAVFTEQKEPTNLRVFVDTDQAGCAIARKSTTGIIMFLGQHPVKHSSNLQSTVSLSSGESEYYGLVKGGSVGLGIQALFTDWGLEMGLTVLSDSSAARGHVSRRGLGKMRHIQTRYLWLQERVGCGHLVIKAVPGTKNPADVLTKSVSGKLMWKHLEPAFQRMREESRLHRKI